MTTHEKKKWDQLIEPLVFLVYMVLLSILLFYHEPWFDEAQAWLIARDASIRELLTVITHYEGHPPLWYLLLMPLAKGGVPFEFGLKSINFLFAASSMGLVIFKAPFRRLLRCVLPFTYFFFYQYGVISRPYSMMLLGFTLSALFYADKNRRPVRFVAAIALVCCSSAYGMVLSAGIVMTWLWEIIREQPLRHAGFSHWLKDRRIQSMLVLFVFNLGLVWMIVPASDAFGTRVLQANPFIVRLFYLLFIAPADAACSISYFDSRINIQLDTSLISSLFLGLLIIAAILLITRSRGKTGLFLLPCVLFALFGSAVYFSVHHVGILAAFYLFLIWCCLGEPQRESAYPRFVRKILEPGPNARWLKTLGIGLLSLIMLTNLYWTVSASINDLLQNYGTGRETSAFIKEYQLDQLTVMAGWNVYTDSLTGEETRDYNFTLGVPELAYFDRNFLINFNGGQDGKCYLTHRTDSVGSSLKAIAVRGYPDVLFGYVDLEDLYGSRISIKDYALVESIHGHTIWKDRVYQDRQLIFLRRDLLKDYPQLTEHDLLDEMVLG